MTQVSKEETTEVTKDYTTEGSEETTQQTLGMNYTYALHKIF